MSTLNSADPPSMPPVGPPQPPDVKARRRGVLSYVIVAVLSIALGAVAMRMAPRFGFTSEAPAPTAQAPSAASDDPMAGMSPDGEAPSDKAVFISPARQQLIGVRTAVVSRQTLDTTIRTVGVLAYDETRIAEVHTKIAGWIDQASVNFVGKPVRRGQALFSVYSPDLVSTQKEYLLALRAQAQLGQSRFSETRDGAVSMLAAARERLRLWDITDAQVAELEKTGQARKSLTVYSPFDGIVLERNAFMGQYVTPEMSAFKIADLSTIWVIGQVFENELPLIKVGQTTTIEFPNGGSRALSGQIAYIYPDIDPMTRRAKVRIELRNPGLEFKPETYVAVVMRAGAGQRLAVPKEAVVDTGVKRYAIVALADGYFEPREIQVGESVDDFYPVVSGLDQGDRVVTSAQFLVDSETNLQSAMQAMASMPGMDTGAKGTGKQGTGEQPPKPATPAAAAPALTITFRSQPDPPQKGDNAFEVAVRDGQGQPVTDATVTVTFFMPPMPSMGMPAVQSAAALAHGGDGVYRGTAQVPSPGRFDVTVTVSRAGQRLASKRLALVVQ